MFQMILFLNKWKRGQHCRRLLALLCLFATVFCILVLLTPGLPEVSPDSWSRVPTSKSRPDEADLGKLGLLMIDMLPQNLAFTVFAPSEEAFEHVLKLQSNNSLTKSEENATMAVLSHVISFCTVPQHVPSDAVPFSKELVLDAVSGFRLYISKMSDGTLLANNVRSKQIDLRKGEIIVHVMNCVIMDLEFEQSFTPDYEDYRMDHNGRADE